MKYELLLTIWKSDLSNEIKWEFFQTGCHVSTIVWLYHLDFNEMCGEKVSWELPKDVVCCFEQILKIRWMKHTRHCWRSKEKLISKILWTPTHGHTSVAQPAKTYIHQFCADTRCCLEESFSNYLIFFQYAMKS